MHPPALFHRHENPHQREEADCVMTVSTEPEDLLAPEADDNLTPCDTALQPHHQPIRELITYPVTFLPPPAFKKPCLKPMGWERGSREAAHTPSLTPVVNTTLSFFTPHASRLTSLHVCEQIQMGLCYNSAGYASLRWGHDGARPTKDVANTKMLGNCNIAKHVVYIFS